jgi:hypothetical protein
MPPANSSPRALVVSELQGKILRFGGQRADFRRSFSTGCDALDRLLPDGGLRPGSVVEWLSPGPGSGVTLLALSAARGVLASGTTVMCDRERCLYPNAWPAVLTDMRRVLLVRAKDNADHAWAITQSLRSPAVAVVWARLAQVNDRASRRFQLAAESGGTLGLFVRPQQARGKPTWADVQLCVEPLANGRQRRWRIECVRARGPTQATTVVVERDELTGTLRAVSACHETPPLPHAAGLAGPTQPGLAGPNRGRAAYS